MFYFQLFVTSVTVIKERYEDLPNQVKLMCKAKYTTTGRHLLIIEVNYKVINFECYYRVLSSERLRKIFISRLKTGASKLIVAIEY